MRSGPLTSATKRARASDRTIGGTDVQELRGRLEATVLRAATQRHPGLDPARVFAQQRLRIAGADGGRVTIGMRGRSDGAGRCRICPVRACVGPYRPAGGRFYFLLNFRI